MKLNELTASKIRDFRKSMGYTVEAVAKDLGISKTAYSQMENGHIEITLARVEAIANVYNIPIWELIPIKNMNTVVTNGNVGNDNSTNTVNNFFSDNEEKIKSLISTLSNVLENLKKAN